MFSSKTLYKTRFLCSNPIPGLGQSFIMNLDTMFRQILTRIHQQIDQTLERTPIVRTVKHLIEAFRGGRVNTILYFDSLSYFVHIFVCFLYMMCTSYFLYFGIYCLLALCRVCAIQNVIQGGPWMRWVPLQNYTQIVYRFEKHCSYINVHV